MKNCPNCGRQIDDYAIFCSQCGARQGASYTPFGAPKTESGRYYTDKRTVGKEKGSFWIALISFIIPVVGALLWYNYRLTRPALSQAAAHGAISGVCVSSPIVGLVIWLTLRDKYREFARVAGISAIIGASLSLVFGILAGFLQAYGVTIGGYTVAEILNFLYG